MVVMCTAVHVTSIVVVGLSPCEGDVARRGRWRVPPAKQKANQYSICFIWQGTGPPLLQRPHVRACRLSRCSQGRMQASHPHVAVVVKLGGAAITHKGQLETLNAEVLSTTAAQLAQSIQEHGLAGGAGTILVHGAGSFGHQQAHRTGVHRGGIQQSLGVRHGFAETRASVTKLNNLVVQALLEENVLAVGLSPCGAWTTSNRQVVVDGCGAVQAVLAAGLVPVLHGDAVFDQELGCTILGGDALLARLCEAFRPQCAVFLTNVPGIYSHPPGHAQAELLSRIEVRSDGCWVGTCHTSGQLLTHMDVETSTGQHDTTGGIQAKIEEAARIAVCMGVEVRIAQAGTPHALEACRRGPVPEGWLGTVVVSS